MQYPKISVVTPSYNQGQYLETTLRSVIEQGYPMLQYVVVDGGSTDRSVEILERYGHRLHWWVSEPDGGMYEAIQKGFERTDGEIMLWINSDDVLHPGALFTIAQLFTQLPEVEWVTGASSTLCELGQTVAVAPAQEWSKFQFYQREYQWIQQESTVWRRSLWKRSGGELDTTLKLAGDFELWLRFFGHAKLYVTDALIGAYRARSSNQASVEGLERYHKECHRVLDALTLLPEEEERLSTIRSRETMLRMMKGIGKSKMREKLIRPLYEFPPRIFFDRMEQRFRLRGK